MQPSDIPLALVTGAARRLGKSLAATLARKGYAIGLHFNQSRGEAESAAAELNKVGQPVYLFQADLTSPVEIEQMFASVGELPHHLRVLVNSAGVMPKSDIRTIPVEEWDATLALNLRAPLLCAQQAARLMGDRGGVIVNLSDAGAVRSWTGFPAYLVSKVGLETLTRLLARSLAPAIRVNAIAPGLVLKGDQIPMEDWSRLVDRVPLRRKGDPDEIGQALVFLIENEYITGQTLVVDGGYQLV